MLLFNSASGCWRSAPASVATLWHFRLMTKYPPGCLSYCAIVVFVAVVVVFCYKTCCCRRRRWRKAILSFATGHILLTMLLLWYLFVIVVMFCCCCCCYFISLQCRQPFFTFSAHSVFTFFLAPLFCRTRYCCCFYFPFSRAICAFVLLLFFARASPFNSYYFCIFFCFCSRAFFF